jgi:streptogramin lyase
VVHQAPREQNRPEHDHRKIQRVRPTDAEWRSPGNNGRPRRRVWFSEYHGNKISRITTTGEFSEFPLPTPKGGPFAPNGITAGPDGAVWFMRRFATGQDRPDRQINEEIKSGPQTFHWERWILYLEIVTSLAIIIARRLKRLHLH